MGVNQYPAPKAEEADDLRCNPLFYNVSAPNRKFNCRFSLLLVSQRLWCLPGLQVLLGYLERMGWKLQVHFFLRVSRFHHLPPHMPI